MSNQIIRLTSTHYKKMLLRPRFKNAAIGPKNVHYYIIVYLSLLLSINWYFFIYIFLNFIIPKLKSKLWHCMHICNVRRHFRLWERKRRVQISAIWESERERERERGTFQNEQYMHRMYTWYVTLTRTSTYKFSTSS